MSTELSFTVLTTNQANKEASINTAFEEVDAVMTQALEIEVVGGSATAAFTPTPSECKRNAIYRFIDDTGTPPTDCHLVTFIMTDMVSRYFLIQNDTTHTHVQLMLDGSTQTDLSLVPGEAASFYFEDVTPYVKKMVNAQDKIMLPSVRVASTVNVASIATLNTGDAMDGVTLAVGDLVLLKNQTSVPENGVYIVGNVGAFRVPYMRTAVELPKGTLVSVREGTLSGGKTFTMSSAQATIGTDNNTWAALAATAGGSIAFLDLTDVPGNYTTDGLKHVRVNAGETALEFVFNTESFEVALSDETTALATGTGVASFVFPYDFKMTEMFTAVTQAQSSSGAVTVDAKEAGSTILTTKPSIDASEDTSLTGTAAVLLTTTFTKGDILKFNIDAAGTGAKGLKVVMNGYQTS